MPSALPQAAANHAPARHRIPRVRTDASGRRCAPRAAGRSSRAIDAARDARRGFVARLRRSSRPANGEIHATYREQVGKHGRGGEIVIFGVDGLRLSLAARSFPIPASIIDYMMSSPIMLAQLAALLLDQGVLGPPSDVTSAAHDHAPRARRATSARRRRAWPRSTPPPWYDDRHGASARAPTRSAFYAAACASARSTAAATPSRARPTRVTPAKASRPSRRTRATLPDSIDLTGWKILRGERRPLAMRDAVRRRSPNAAAMRQALATGPYAVPRVEARGEEARAMPLRRLRRVEHLARRLEQERARRRRSLANQRSCGGYAWMSSRSSSEPAEERGARHAVLARERGVGDEVRAFEAIRHRETARRAGRRTAHARQPPRRSRIRRFMAHLARSAAPFHR